MHYLKWTVLLIVLLFAIPSSAQHFSEALPRHGELGAQLSFDDASQRAFVRSVNPEGFAASIGLQAADTIHQLNSIRLTSARQLERLQRTMLENTTVTFVVQRNGQRHTYTGRLPARARENNTGVITEYKSIATPYGYRVQVIITRPENTTTPIPGIFFVRWMSCDPVEIPDPAQRVGIDHLLYDLIENSGYALIRVEKPGLGDSQGPPCSEVDFQQELAAHQVAFRAFRELDYVDPQRIIVLGQSNGAAYAPLVTTGYDVAAYVVTGGWSKTWYEHMLEIERQRFTLQGLSPAEVTARLKLVEELYYHLLIRKKQPGEVLEEHPHLRKVWFWGNDGMYGLPIAYVQQLQDLNIAEAWSKVDVPVYVLYGEYDWAMSEEDHRLIAQLVNANGPELATFELVPQMHHSLYWFDSMLQGYQDFSSGVYRPFLAEKIMAWMRRMLGAR